MQSPRRRPGSAEPGGAISQDRASTRSSFRGRAGLSERTLTPMGAGGGVGCATGEERGARVRGQHTSRGIEAGPEIAPAPDRLRTPAHAEKQGRRTVSDGIRRPGGAASLALANEILIGCAPGPAPSDAGPRVSRQRLSPRRACPDARKDQSRPRCRRGPSAQPLSSGARRRLRTHTA